MNSVKIVGEFRNVSGRLVTRRDRRLRGDDFVITTGGVDVVSRTEFKKWGATFMSEINDLRF
jgi:hypothetical protein